VRVGGLVPAAAAQPRPAVKVLELF